MYLSKWLRNLGVLVLLILPFQGLPPTLLGLNKPEVKETVIYPVWVKAFKYLDEMSFFIFLGLGVTFFCLKPTVYRLPRLPVTKWLIAFIAFGAFLAVIKAIPFLQAGFGIYDLLKNIIVLYVFAMMHFSEGEFISLVRYVTRIGFLFAIVAIWGEFMALAFKVGIGYLVVDDIRWGLYRILSLAGYGNHNYLGLYGILCFFLSYAVGTKREVNFIKKGSLLAMIFLTMSRQAWLGFLVIFIIFKHWLRYFFPLLPLFAFLIIYSLGQKHELDPDTYFRLYTLYESAKIVVAHPLTGLGPGMFGDLASIIWESPVYDQWPILFKEFVYRIRSIDTFWPIIWGGYGLVGLALYCSVWLSLFTYLGNAATSFKNSGADNLYNIGRTLKYFMIALAIMGFASGINSAFVAYTYFALVGIYVSLYERNKGRTDDLSELPELA